ncbi:sortase A [Metabacillus crassostreae]|uniref:class D sortase n=1 Tax=Metabacillus crassostreae TaxID=929098 RepID=UPI00195B8A55|nr:class D sortase [Metabacillus crassostreae]MBM7605610.1 sortase A [Metabacillus crassostreae]
MEPRKYRKGSKKKIKIKTLSFFIILLFLLGLYVSSTNAFKLLKGYTLFKVNQTESAAVSKQHDTKGEGKVDLSSQLEKGDLIGTLIIPKLDASLPIYHGTDEDELEKGVGHFAQSVLPGKEDNSVLSGHRDTVFRRLGEVGVGDLLTVETTSGTFTYKVRKVRIVDKDDRTVIVPKPKATLTLSTCYPFDFVGSAPERYVLVADLTDKKM